MTSKRWKNRIKKACEDVGTYQESFNDAINILSEILEKRDETMKTYDGRPVVEHTNSHGETNIVKNPSLMLWIDLNTQALAYWKELGLTPAAYKKISGDKPVEKRSALVEALKSLGA